MWIRNRAVKACPSLAQMRKVTPHSSSFGEMKKEKATKVASMAKNGYARVMRPAHSMYDGDTIFAMALWQHWSRSQRGGLTIGKSYGKIGGIRGWECQITLRTKVLQRPEIENQLTMGWRWLWKGGTIMRHEYIERRPTMRTTLDLPEDLIDEAMKATQIKTKTKVIITALEDLIRKSKISGLKEYKGKVDLDINMNAARGRQCQY
jgi:Arc/MetJ family transcription regulator